MKIFDRGAETTVFRIDFRSGNMPYSTINFLLIVVDSGRWAWTWGGCCSRGGLLCTILYQLYLNIDVACRSTIIFSVKPVAQCVCLCVCCLPIYSGCQTCGRTSRGHTGVRSHRISYPPSFCGACLSFSREKDSAVPFPRRRPRSRILMYPRINRSPTCWA